MHRWTLACAIGLLFTVAASGNDDFSEVDAHVDRLVLRTSDVHRLAHRLTEKFADERDKVRAIFYWVATNVAYDTKRYRSPRKQRAIRYRTKTELMRKRQLRLDRRIRRTLRLKKGVCQDYADLFTALCTAVGISSQTISGTVRKSPYQIGRSRFGTNHAWNIVRIQGKAYLIDATWASGYTDRRVTTFTPRLNNAFFLADPEKLIYTHFPRLEEHQLLTETVDRETYSQFPVTTSYLLSSAVNTLSPNSDLVADTSVCVSLGLQSSNDRIDVMLQDRDGLIPSVASQSDSLLRVCGAVEDAQSGPLKVWVAETNSNTYRLLATYLKRRAG